MLTKIWERYFVKEFLKVFFFFLFCFYGLYVLIDYAGHTSALPHHQNTVPTSEIVRYYVNVFATRAEILIPFALVIALIKTLCTLNVRNELVALMAGGFRIKTLLKPFIGLAIFFTLLLYLNEQYLLPIAMKELRHLKDLSKHRKGRRHPEMAVHPIILEDSSLLLFQSFDSVKEQFFDVYWIQSVDHIYRMKFLFPYSTIPRGFYVDEFKRTSTGELVQKKSFKELAFANMQFNEEVLQSALLDPDALSISDLWNRLPHPLGVLNEKDSKVLTAFYWKLLLPWLCLMAILAPAPFCVRYSRTLPVFLIYVCGMFGLLAFYLFMDAAQVVAKRQVLQPLWALVVPFGLTFSYFIWRFTKIK